MIINGGSRANFRFFARHLMRADENERVEIKELRGVLSGTVPEALREMEAIASGTRTENFLYHANLNPDEGEQLTAGQWREAVDRLERNLGLEGHARVVVEHEKNGRTHQHVIWNRIDPDTMTAASDSFDYRRHQQTAREIEEAFGLRPVESVTVKDRKTERPERNPKDWESFRGRDSGIDPKAVTADITALWHEADSGRAFAAALEECGYVLCRGDRRDFCIVDQAGDEHSLARRIKGVKAAEIRARLVEIDRDALPSVAEARELAGAVAGNAGDAGDATKRAEPPVSESAPVPVTPEPSGAAQLETTADIKRDASRFGGAEPVAQAAAPTGTPADWREAAVTGAPSGESVPQGTAQDWQPASGGQGSDQREPFTAWEAFAGRVRGYWQWFVEFVQDVRGGAARDSGEPTPEPGPGAWERLVTAGRQRPGPEGGESFVERFARRGRDILGNERGSVPDFDTPSPAAELSRDPFEAYRQALHSERDDHGQDKPGLGEAYERALWQGGRGSPSGIPDAPEPDVSEQDNSPDFG